VAVASDTRCALVVVAVALFGLLSMHGWGSHAGMHPAGMTTEGAHPMVTQAPHRLAAHDAEGQAAADAGYRAGAVGDEEPSGGDLGLLGLCLAVLGGLLSGLALLLLRRGGWIARTLLPSWSATTCRGRDRDPPDLLRLGVIRC